MIFIFLAASPPRAKGCLYEENEKETEKGNKRTAEVADGWQSVEASGADQWPDGGNSGILTLQPAKGGGGAAVAADAAASCSRYTVCGAGCTQRQRMLVTRT